MARKSIPFNIADFYTYDPNTGDIRYKVDTYRRVRKAGDLCNNRNYKGYIVVSHKNRRYMAHRVAWLIHYGEQPPETIDHINQVVDDNRICNLRAASQRTNMVNSGKTAGVTWLKNRQAWQAYFCSEKLYYGRDLLEAYARRISRVNAYHRAISRSPK
jgi:hypothetical protein